MLRIVVVEETRELAATIEHALKQELLDAHVVSDGERGLELARDLPADLVVLDISAPGIDGVETCRHGNSERLTHTKKMTHNRGKVPL
ncbi:MAG TPA: response regulator, partial [Conexibacter sp.]|nr:response regulator [Conexibacter sp.]